MLRWALTGVDAGKVTTKGNAAYNLSGVYETGKTTVEGKVDRINNIYDLEGNGCEWTVEEINTDYRSGRGGYYGDGYSPSYRTYSAPTNAYDNICSRLALYIK